MNNNKLDFSIVRRQIFMCYSNLQKQGYDLSWERRDYEILFSFFYENYKKRFKRDHPRLTNEQITTILCDLPSFTDEYSECEIEATPRMYAEMILSYFEQKFDAGMYGRCNYSLLHFVSGKIRYFRYCEALERNDE